MMNKLLVAAALSISSLAFAGPMHGARPVAPRSPPPPVVQNNEARGDRFDVAQGRRLLRDFDHASARRDGRALRMVEQQFASFINEELNESRREERFDRRERSTTRQLMNLQSQLTRLSGRFDARALQAKRQVYETAVNIAERDLRDSRSDRFARR